jgi:hypothetical protein
VIGVQQSAENKLVAFRETKRVPYEGEFNDTVALDKFFTMNTLPICPTVDGKNFQALLMSGFPFVMFSANLTDPKHAEMINQFKTLATENSQRVHALLDSTVFSRFIEMLKAT